MYNIINLTIDNSNKIKAKSNLNIVQNSTNNKIVIDYVNEYANITISFTQPSGWVSPEYFAQIVYDKDTDAYTAEFTIPEQITTFLIANQTNADLKATINMYGYNNQNSIIKASTVNVMINTEYSSNEPSYSLLTAEESTQIHQAINELSMKVSDIESGDVNIPEADHALTADVAEYAKEPYSEGTLHDQSVEQTGIMDGSIKVPHAILSDTATIADGAINATGDGNLSEVVNWSETVKDGSYSVPNASNSAEADHSLTTNAAKEGSELSAHLSEIDATLLSKLDSDLSKLPLLSNIGDDDVLLFRSGNDNYKYTGKQLKEFAANPNNLFLGTFDSYLTFIATHANGESGQYAYVNEINEDGTNSLNMFVWDTIDSEWHREGAGVYVSYTVYNELEKRIIAREEYEDANFTTFEVTDYQYSDDIGLTASYIMAIDGTRYSADEIIRLASSGGYDDTELRNDISETKDLISGLSDDIDQTLVDAKAYTDEQLANVDVSAAVTEAKAYTDEKLADIDLTAAVDESKAYTDTKVADLVNSSPEALDTLQELADALGNDPNFATTVATQLGQKLTKTEAEETYVPLTRTINGQALSDDITLNTSDLVNDSNFMTSDDIGILTDKTEAIVEKVTEYLYEYVDVDTTATAYGSTSTVISSTIGSTLHTTIAEYITNGYKKCDIVFSEARSTTLVGGVGNVVTIPDLSIFTSTSVSAYVPIQYPIYDSSASNIYYIMGYLRLYGANSTSSGTLRLSRLDTATGTGSTLYAAGIISTSPLTVRIQMRFYK